MRRLSRELRNRLGLIVLSATVLGLACSSKSSRDADWEEVQKAATRVESGLRHETLIALRSKVADLDAAVENYTRHHPEGQKEQRVRSINQAVDALEWGIDHDRADVIWEGTDGFDFYLARQYLNAKPKCAESKGRLYISRHDLSAACLAYAQSTLLEPDEPSTVRQYDFNALRTKCAFDYGNYQNKVAQQAQAERVEKLRAASARRAERLRDWPLQMDVETAGGEFPFYYYSDDDSVRRASMGAEEIMHIEAKRKVRILAYKKTYRNALVKVNGKVWTPKWSELPKSSLGEIEATITLEQ